MWHVMEQNINANRALGGKPEGKRPPRRPMCTWEDNIKVNIKERGFEGVDEIHTAQNRYK